MQLCPSCSLLISTETLPCSISSYCYNIHFNERYWVLIIRISCTLSILRKDMQFPGICTYGTGEESANPCRVIKTGRKKHRKRGKAIPTARASEREIQGCKGGMGLQLRGYTYAGPGVPRGHRYSSKIAIMPRQGRL